MKFLKKGLCMCLAFLSVFMPGCAKDNPAQKDVYEFERKENIIEDHQAYEHEKIHFDDDLFKEANSYNVGKDYRNVYGENLNGIYLESVPLENGEISRVFAYVGIPESATAENKDPAIVLVHGGGGTSFAEWVRLWMERGYVAIAPDTEGNMPQAGSYTEGAGKIRNTRGGPENTQYRDSTKPVEDQFLYHGAAAAILCNTYLRNLEVVDKDKIGICGVSWGGVITSIVTGYDDRFAFSIPIYGTLNLTNSHGSFAGLLQANPKAQIWDETDALEAIKTPILWLNGANDQFFSFDASTKSYLQSKQGFISVINGFNHSHSSAWNREEPYRFADSVVKGGVKLIKVTKQPTFEDKRVDFLVPNGCELQAIKLLTSSDSVPTKDTLWEETWLKDFNNNSVAFELEEDVNMFCLEIMDKSQCITSTVLVSKGDL